MKHRILIPVVLGLLLGWGMPGRAQEAGGGSETKSVPILTGYTSFITTFQSGVKSIDTSINPILLIPVGRRWLVESEFEYEGDFDHQPDGTWEKEYERNLEYLQLNFLAHRNLTVVAGRFLTPFGILNERLHPSWILNIPVFPLIHPLEMGSGNGLQLRGGARVSSGVNLNYAGYLSALTTSKVIEANRNAGGRWSIFLPNHRLEIGTSFQRLLQDERFNTWGLDATWQPYKVPLDFRLEYARSHTGSGYWAEGAYRLRRINVLKPFFRKSQAVVRVEQFFAPTRAEEEMEAGHEELPEVNTKRLLLGWNYYVRDGLKLGFAYGREFSSMGDRNVWSFGLGYRWLF